MVREAALMAVIAGGAGAAAGAHHSIAGIYDSSKPVSLQGTVAAFLFVNPHPFVEIDVPAPGGMPQRWRLELDNRFELTNAGMTADTLKPGDRVAVTGSAARDGSRSAYVRRLQRSDGFLYEQVGSSPRVRMPGR